MPVNQKLMERTENSIASCMKLYCVQYDIAWENKPANYDDGP
jgi:hypothetical protein